MSKFEKLCEEVLQGLYEGMPSAGKDATVDGKEARTSEGHNKGLKEDDDKDIKMKYKVAMDEALSDMDKADDDSEDMKEAFKKYKEAKKMYKKLDDEDEIDEAKHSDKDDDKDEMEEGFPKVGGDVHVDGSELQKKNY